MSSEPAPPNSRWDVFAASPGAATADSADRAALDKSDYLIRAYDEYMRRCKAGEKVGHDEFLAQHPRFRSALAEALLAADFVDAHLEDKDVERLAAADWPEVGNDHVGFRVLRELGRGRFARVYLASETALGGRLVALKVSRHGSAEAKKLGRLSHPNVVPVHSVQQDPATGKTVVCMPYLGSATLADVLDYLSAVPGARRRAYSLLAAVWGVGPAEPGAPPQPPAAVLLTGSYVDGVLHLAVQLADALAFLHDRGCCHGDLKPSNVLVCADGRPMLLDFNLAFQKGEADQRLGGTLPYMAPEQLRALDAARQSGGEAAQALPVEPPADLFALGVVLYELLTGAHPFGPLSESWSFAELKGRIEAGQRAGFRPVRAVNPDVERSLARLVERCLADAPADRPPSAAALAAALRKHLSPAWRTRRWVSARRVLVTATVGLGLLAGLAAWTFLAPHEPYAEHQLHRGQEAYRQGSYAEALTYFEKALEAEPESAWAYFYRGRAHQKLDQWDLAQADYYKADQLLQDGRIKACMGYCANRMFDHAQAVRYYTDALNLGFRSPALLNNLGYSCAQQPDQAVAVKEYLDQAIALDGRLQAAYFNRALVESTLVEQGKHTPEQAIRDIETAIALGPPAADLHYHAAYFYALAARQTPQNSGPALDHVEKAIALGRPPQDFAYLKWLEGVGQSPRLERLLKQAAAPLPVTSTPKLLDPLQDVAIE
jgi:serine/threonine protein kinase